MTQKTISIGCSSGFWGDSSFAAEQLVNSGRIHYLVSDYLAEITMSLLARARARNQQAGFPQDFIDALVPLLPEIKRQGIRVVSNAGGINPRACREALQAAAQLAGIELRIAVIEGDDLLACEDAIRSHSPTEMFSGQAMPERFMSCNAYLGARPIALALDASADVVLTGRCVDSAVTLGILMHEFKWKDSDYDLLAAGSLAGHVIECGPQCTGGIFTDWQAVPNWEDMGYPIVECAADGSFVVTKPEGTGGLVSVGTVSEQIVYEIGDPQAYILPDVVCDFTQVQVQQQGTHRVVVTGARGRPPTPSYKVSATYADGWRTMATMMVAGHEAAAKARRMGQAIVERTRKLNRRAGRADYRETLIEVIGANQTYGQPDDTAREVILKIGLHHDDRAALELFGKEMTQAGVAMAQGTTGLFGGRPTPSPVIRLFSFLYPKESVPVTMDLMAATTLVAIAPGVVLQATAAPDSTEPSQEPGTVELPLIALAFGRSGDKGNDANIGIIARRAEFMPVLAREVTPERVKAFFSHYVQGNVQRWELKGMHAFNFLLSSALGGGGMASLRYDPQGKSYAQMLLDMPVRVPAAWVQADGRQVGDASRLQTHAESLS